VRDLRQHVVAEPWLEARPLSEHEQLVYQLLLRHSKATSHSLLKDLSANATSLRMVQRILVRPSQLGLVEKIGSRKDAYYRLVGLQRLENVDDDLVATADRAGSAFLRERSS
jgi:hypothetical protein